MRPDGGAAQEGAQGHRNHKRRRGKDQAEARSMLRGGPRSGQEDARRDRGGLQEGRGRPERARIRKLDSSPYCKDVQDELPPARRK